MKDDSPNALVMRPPLPVARMGKWPLAVLCVVLACLLAALIYSISFVHDPERRKKDEEKVESAVTEEEKPVWLVEGSGLALDPKKEQVSGVVTPERPVEKEEPIIVVQREEKPDLERENLRRAKAQAFMNALSAPLVVRRQTARTLDRANVAEVAAEARNSTGISQPALSGLTGAGSGYDPAAEQDKENFFERAAQDNSWRLMQQRTPGLPLELKTGSVIPGVMLTGVNSDLPGNMIAQVAQNVYDTATGRHLLIPRGSRLYGVYDSRVIYGQERVLIAWNRIMFPDGSSIAIGAMPGADMAGMAGFNDDVDNHYLRIFGSALMMSLVSGGMAYAMDGMNNSLTTDNGTSMQDEMTSALAAQLGQTTTTLLQKNLSIKPTLEIRPGYLFNIVVTKDMVFREPYTRWRQ